MIRVSYPDNDPLYRRQLYEVIDDKGNTRYYREATDEDLKFWQIFTQTEHINAALHRIDTRLNEICHSLDSIKDHITHISQLSSIAPDALDQLVQLLEDIKRNTTPTTK